MTKYKLYFNEDGNKVKLIGISMAKIADGYTDTFVLRTMIYEGYRKL